MLHPLAEQPQCLLKTRHCKRTVKFLTKATELLKQLEVEHYLQKLTQSFDKEGGTVRNIECLECIEMNIDKALFKADALLPNYPAYSLTVEIHHANLLVNYWAAEKSFKRNMMLGLDILEDMKDIIPLELDIYQGGIARPPYLQLYRACKWRRQVQTDGFAKCQEELQQKITAIQEGRKKDTLVKGVAKIIKKICNSEQCNKTYYHMQQHEAAAKFRTNIRQCTRYQ
eukprot:3903619-Ditylum_brightwellii.AAC.1